MSYGVGPTLSPTCWALLGEHKDEIAGHSEKEGDVLGEEPQRKQSRLASTILNEARSRPPEEQQNGTKNKIRANSRAIMPPCCFSREYRALLGTNKWSEAGRPICTDLSKQRAEEKEANA